MGRLKLSVANAGGLFSASDVLLFERSASAAEQFMSSLFEFDYDVDVIITSPSYLLPTIPEDRIGGRTYNSRLIILTIDNERTPIQEDFVFETMCHELSHSLRWEKVADRADTLLHTIIFEGLAAVLEELVMEHTKRESIQFFLHEVRQTDTQTIGHISKSLRPLFNSPEYDYEKVFFTGDDSLPRWAGYKLGYSLVKKYLTEHNATIQQATLTGYDDIARKVI